jgi:hypothetical protein
MRVERRIHLEVAPDAIYELVMDPARLGDWVTIQEELVEAPERILEKGDRLVQRLKVAGQGFEVSWAVTRADRPTHVEWHGRGPLGTSAKVAYTFAEASGGTEFGYMNEYELPGGVAGRLAGRAVASMAGREAEKTLATLKRLVEDA